MNEILFATRLSDILGEYHSGQDRMKFAVSIGTVLIELKRSEHGKHGNWALFLQKQFPNISLKTARNYMRVVKKTTANQRSGKTLVEIYREIKFA